MNRRTTLSILGFGFAAVSTFSVFKWLGIYKTPDIKMLLSNKSLIAELAETIIPRTDTVGAKDAKVEEFIIDFVTTCTDTKNQNLFIDGLAELEAYAHRVYNKNYEACTEEQRIKILSHFEQHSESQFEIVSKVRNKLFGRSFFKQLKELTVIGYCTSQPGATQGLAYDYIPGTFNSCTMLLPEQKSWATK